MANFIENLRDAALSLASPVWPIGSRKSTESKKTTETSSPARRTATLPAQKVWGFEEDKSRYNDVDPRDSETINSLHWRDYSVVPRDNERGSSDFSVGYDRFGNISGIRSRGADGVARDYYGREAIKKFFSQFDRDATRYRVWQNENYGKGDNAAAMIFDSDSDTTPWSGTVGGGAFIPSAIFRDYPITIADPAPASSVNRTYIGDRKNGFVQNWRRSR